MSEWVDNRALRIASIPHRNKMASRSEVGAGGTPGIELFTTSTASDVKTKKDCYRLRALLEAKRVPFVEVRMEDCFNGSQEKMDPCGPNGHRA